MKIVNTLSMIFVLAFEFDYVTAAFDHSVTPWCGSAVKLCEIELNVTRNETMKIFDSMAVPQADPVILGSGNSMHVRKCRDGSNSYTDEMNYAGKICCFCSITRLIACYVRRYNQALKNMHWRSCQYIQKC